MGRTELLGVTILGLAVLSGCRSNCNDRCGITSRADLASRLGHRDTDCNECPPFVPTSIGRPVSVTPGSTIPSAGWMPDSEFGLPAYPGGEPIPIRPGTATPPNELPYPNIPAPGVPESPAQPTPAIPPSASVPGAAARTVGNIRLSK
jgi:hypothetical protein